MHKATIYNEVMSFCEKRGLIEKLEKSFLIPESERFNALNVAELGLNVLDAVHCIYDMRRTNFFEEIGRKVFKGCVVLEAGIGTGILSFYAASMGAQVYGCEINPDVLELAQEIKNHMEKNKFIPVSSVEFFLYDAITFVPPKNTDILISENVYTGMFFEYQVQIVNNLLKYLNTGGICIPQKIRSFTSLSQTIFPRLPKNKELFVPSHEGGEKMVYTLLSAPYQYDEIDFTKVSASSVHCVATISIENDGLVNSLLVYSEVLMPSGRRIGKDDTTFLNNEIVIAISPSIKVEKGNKVELVIQYDYNSKPQDATIAIRKMH